MSGPTGDRLTRGARRSHGEYGPPVMSLRRKLLAVLASSIAVWSLPPTAAADDDRGGSPDENVDRATPQPAPADDRPSPEPAVSTAEGDFTIFAATASAPRPFIDDF